MNPFDFRVDTNLLVRITFLLFLLFSCWIIALPQKSQKTNHVPLDPPQRPVNCETAQAYINDALILYSKDKSGYFIIIAKLGTGESARDINLGRLNSVRTYIYQFETPIQTVFAEAGNKNGFGAIEIYINGDLLYSLPVAKRKILDLRSCLHA